MVTSLVSLTEAGLMKPLGGSLTSVRMCVQPEQMGQSIYTSLASLETSSLVIIWWFKKNTNYHDLSSSYYFDIWNGTMFEDMHVHERVLEEHKDIF